MYNEYLASLSIYNNTTKCSKSLLICNYCCSYEFTYLETEYNGIKWGSYFGININNPNCSFRFVREGENEINVANGGNETTFKFTAKPYEITKFYATKNGCSLNNKYLKSFLTNNNTTKFNKSLLIFMSRDSDNLQIGGSFYFYGMKVWDENEKLIGDYRPCLDSSKVPCIYDEVQGKFLYNRGTGVFEYGYGIPE